MRMEGLFTQYGFTHNSLLESERDKGKVKYIEIPPRERTAQQGGGYERVTGAFDQCL